MKQKVVTARVSGDIYAAIAAKASAEGVSLSAVAARLMGESLKADDGSPDRPDWAVALEQRLSQVEALVSSDSRGGSRKGKRR